MKKILLLALAFSIGFMGFSQIATIPKSLRNQVATMEYQKPVSDIIDFSKMGDPTVRSTQLLPEETTVGISQYDLWSNTMIGTNLHMFNDGTMAATWTLGIQSSTFPDRGTGYNYYDGGAWGPQPTTRLESVRTGWGHIAPWGPNGEIVVAHNGTNLTLSRRDTKGAGAWTQFNYVGVAQPTWPKHAVSGENNEYLHLVFHSYTEYLGQPGAMLYSRSMDGGDTWVDQNVVLEGTGVDYYFEIQAETYFITAKANTVAILVGGAWNDMFIMKSADNGDTWEKIMIWEHPYPFYDLDVSLSDTVFVPDNSASLAIGPDGKCHVTFGINRTLREEGVAAGSYSYFPWIDGIGYWNEDMPAFSNDLSALAPPQYEYATSEMVEDYNYIGYTQDVDGDGEITLKTDTPTGFPMAYRSIGVSTMPTITVDDQNRIFIVFASTTETFQNTEYNFKKLWARAYDNGIWGEFFHVTQDIFHIFDESIYPSLASKSDEENIYFLYMADGTPGLALDEDHGYQDNQMIMAALPKEDVLTAIKIPEIISQESVSQNYPNPFSGTSTITVNLKGNANLSMEVYNLMGQQIIVKDRGYVKSGTYYFQIEASDLSSGVYFYTVKANNSQVTKKMIVR